MAKPANINFDSAFYAPGANAALDRTEEVLSQYRVLEKATEAGRRNEPLTTDESLDDTQLALIEESQSVIAQLGRASRNEVSERIDEMRDLVPTPLNTGLERAAVQRAVVETESAHGDDFARAHGNRDVRLGELRGFEEENGLTPFSANYSDDLFMTLSWLIVIVILEGVFNAFQFQELQAGGLVGGLILALGVGAANVLLGVGTGFFGWRLLRHVSPRMKLLGLIVTVTLMTGALAMHLALGDLREAIGSGNGTAIDFLVILKPWRWFDYTSVSPFVMVAVGIATFVLAAMKCAGGSHSVCSSYWGHDTLDRRFREAEAEVDDARANLRDAVQNAYEAERAKVRTRFEESRDDVTELRRLRGEALSIARRLDDSVTDEIGRQDIWLRKYRDRNRAVRTSPAPAYFERFPDFSALRSVRLDTAELDALAARAEQVLAENEARLIELEETTLADQIAALELLLGTETAIKDRALRNLAQDRDVPGPTAKRRRPAA